MSSRNTQRWIKNSCSWWETSHTITIKMDRQLRQPFLVKWSSRVTLQLPLDWNHRLRSVAMSMWTRRSQFSIKAKRTSSRNQRRSILLRINLIYCSISLISVDIRLWLDGFILFYICSPNYIFFYRNNRFISLL